MRFGQIAVFEKQVIGDLYDAKAPYLTRWKLLTTPWFAVYVHKIWVHDRDRHMHDHPWSFASLILWGGYVEQLPGKARHRRPGSFAVLRRPGIHSVRTLLREPTWTLVVRGKDHHSWGFMTEDGWEHWRSYIANRRADDEAS